MYPCNLFLNVAEVQWVDSDVRMLVRGHVSGEERQTDYVGNSTYQLGQALTSGPAAAADDAYVARKHASTDGYTVCHTDRRLLTRYSM